MSARLRLAVLILHGALLGGLPALAGKAGALLALPLLLPLPGLWRGSAYVYAGFSLLLVFYAGGLLVEAIATGGAGFTLLAAAAALEFCLLLLFVRLKARENRSAAG